MNISFNFDLAVLLSVVFTVLKLLHIITWSWVWVLSPILVSAWISALVVAVIYRGNRK